MDVLRSAKRADTLLEHVAGLECTQGQGVGAPFEVLPWERRFLKRAFQDGTDAGLTVARGNGKTTLVAAIADATLRGPLRQPRAETVVVASSFAQARLTFDHVMAFGGWDYRSKRWRVHDSPQQASIEDRETGAKVRCVGSDPKRAHGLAPLLVLADEPAQWPPTSAEAMRAALTTACGKIPGSRFIAFGTRPATSDHWFAKMLRSSEDYAQVHAAPIDAPVTHRRTWKRANPSLDFMPHLEERIRKECRESQADSSLMAAFRALRLNQGVADVVESLLVEAGTWQRHERGEGPTVGDGGYVLGLDLGGSEAMSAAAAYWPEDGTLDCLACFSALPDLRERGLRDGVGRRYQDMHERGELMLAGERVADVGALLAAALDRWGKPRAIVADRYRESELRQVLDAVAFPQTGLVTRGQGFLDGGQDVRSFRQAVGRGQVRPVRSLLLRSAMASARTVSDPAGNSKLAKHTQGGRRAMARDDAAAASILAVAIGRRRAASPAPAMQVRVV